MELPAHCRMESMEPPTPGRCDRIVAAALRAPEESLTAQISSRLTAETIERLVAPVAAGTDQDDDAGPDRGGTEGEDAPPALGKTKEAVYVNTLMLQDILGEPEWAELLTPADRR